MRNEWSTIDSIKGVSPDWEILPLQEFSSPEKNSFVNGPFGSDLLSSELVLAGQPVIYIRDIRNGRYLRKSEVFVTNEKYQTLTACQVNYGDVIIAKVGDPPCESAVYDAHESGIVTQDVIRIRTEELRCSQFIAFILNSDIGKRQVKRIKISGTRDRVSLTDFKKIKFPHPPVSEQRKIAKILSTWDKAITTIEQLLAISQLQKKALMQQLLTGKKRLLDENGVRFSGEWRRKPLKDTVEIIYGKSPKEVVEPTGLYPIYGTGGIGGYASEALCEERAVLIGRKGTIDRPLFISEPFWAIDTTFYCLPKSDTDLKWFYYLVSSLKLRSYSEASGVPSLSRETLNSIKILVPDAIEEQQKIAAVLSLADQEISALQEKIDALKQEKKALMQQLLTGKLRVKVQ